MAWWGSDGGRGEVQNALEGLRQGDLTRRVGAERARGTEREALEALNTVLGAFAEYRRKVEDGLARLARGELADAGAERGGGADGALGAALGRVADRMHWYEALLDAIPFPISVTDMDLRWTFINKASTQVMGRQRGDVVGTPCQEWGADICRTPRCGVAMLRAGTPTSRFRQPGLDRDFQVDASYILDRRGQRVGHIEVVQDVTASEDARQTAEALANYSHQAADRLGAALTDLAAGRLSARFELAPGSERERSARDSFARLKVAFESTIQRLSGTLQAIRGAAEETDGSVSMVAAAIEEMTASLQEVARSSADAATISTTASERARQTAETMGELETAAQSIGRVVEMIKGIADQTNLLALNATIEAASAGDAGRGFAVVATEVKQLARQTATATDEIRGLVGSMQQSTQHAVGAIEEVRSVVERIDSVSSSIAAAVEEQTTTMSEIARTVASGSGSGSTSLAAISGRLRDLTQAFQA